MLIIHSESVSNYYYYYHQIFHANLHGFTWIYGKCDRITSILIPLPIPEAFTAIIAMICYAVICCTVYILPFEYHQKTITALTTETVKMKHNQQTAEIGNECGALYMCVCDPCNKIIITWMYVYVECRWIKKSFRV